MSTEIPTDILAFVAEVEASFSDVCKCGHSIPDDHCHGECEIDDCPCDGLPDLATELEQRVGQTVYLIAIVREQHAKLETPDGENLYDGCLCGEISPKDKPCLACDARLSLWDSIVAERDALNVRIAKLEPEAKAWRDGVEVLRELQARVMPCGHEMENLIRVGKHDVTTCGTCLAAKQVAVKP